MTLQKALDEYKNVYMAYRNFAERTRAEYQNDLRHFIGFLEGSAITQVKELGLPSIQRYVAYLEQKGFASLTRKRKVVSIRSFLTFLYQDGHTNTNIASRIVLPFTENTTPYVLTPAECDQIRNACATNSRDAAVIELLLQTGIKLSELTHLTLADVDVNEIGEKNSGFVRLIGSRGKKERVIPLNIKACFALKNYLRSRKHSGNNTLFLNRFDEPLGERGVQKMLRKYLKATGIRQASIHTLRHTFGAHHLAMGTNAKKLRDVMGLKDIRSTSMYPALAREVFTREMQNSSL